MRVALDTNILAYAEGIGDDIRDGFLWRGITIVNPFNESVHPILETMWKKNE